MLIMFIFCDVCSNYHISACEAGFPDKFLVNIGSTFLHTKQRQQRHCDRLRRETEAPFVDQLPLNTRTYKFFCWV